MKQALVSLGEVEELNLLINSPGRDGTIAKKIIEFCRAYCKVFKVILPNRGNSDAAIVALGVDEIVIANLQERLPHERAGEIRRPNGCRKGCRVSMFLLRILRICG